MDISPNCFSIYHIVTFELVYFFQYPEKWSKSYLSTPFCPIGYLEMNSTCYSLPNQPVSALKALFVWYILTNVYSFYAAKLWLILTAFWCTLPFSIEVLFGFRCGYATLHDVNDKTQEDRMESFFLSETCKYLYLVSTEVFVTDYHLRVYKKWKCRNEMIILKAHQELVLSLDQSKVA